MSAYRSISLALIAASALLVGCRDVVAPDAGPASNLTLKREKPAPTSAPLNVTTEYRVEQLGQGSIRELVEIRARFTGLSPIGQDENSPTENVELNFESTEADYSMPSRTRFRIVGQAWAVLDGGDFLAIQAIGPQAVHDVLRIEAVESGKAVADLTSYVQAVSGTLTFDPNFKGWELKLELTGIITPSMIVTPSMLKTISGAASASLQIASNQVTTMIRESEASFASAGLVTRAETKIEDAGVGFVREVHEVHATFTSSVLQPVPQNSALEDIQLDFEINPPDIAGPLSLRFVLDGENWLPADPNAPTLSPTQVIRHTVPIVVVQNGQIVADLTDGTAVSEARLGYDLATKSWELDLEIAGIVTPSDAHVPLFAQTAAARLTAISIGNDSEQITAVQTKSEAKF